MADYVTDGKIGIDLTATYASTSAGSTKQVSYIFQMSLANTASGRLVWEGEKTITKQGEKNAIGF